VNGEDVRMNDAEAQLLRRIQELRARARSGDAEAAPQPSPTAGAAEPPPGDVAAASGSPARSEPRRGVDLETLLAREESLIDDLRSTAAALEHSLPERVERVLRRALDERAPARGIDDLRDLVVSLARQIEQLNRDLLAERLGRIEDLELTLDLFTTGISSIRGDVASVAANVDRVGDGVEDVAAKLDQPLQVTVERPGTQPEHR
jgi:hypothetical protein